VEWLTFNQVTASPYRRAAGAGAILALLGAFSPWAVSGISLFGLVELGSISINAPQAGIIGLFSILGGIAVFHWRGATALLISGIVIAGFVVIFAAGYGSVHVALGWVLSAAGAGLMIYAGYQLNHYRQ
jgi:hypothetical protein